MNDDSEVFMMIRAILASKKDPIYLSELRSKGKMFFLNRILFDKNIKSFCLKRRILGS